MFRNLTPFLLATLGFTLIALISAMPLFEWQISEINTDLPPEFHIRPVWITQPWESLKSDLYVRDQVKRNGNGCSPRQLTYVVYRSQNAERLEEIAVVLYEGATQWLSFFDFPGQFTMAVILSLCGIYIWLFTIWHNRPIAEAFISTILAVIALVILINVWRAMGPLIGAFACLPEVKGRLSVVAKLSKVHYETLLVLFTGVCAEVAAPSIIVWQMIKAATKGKESSKPAVG